MDNPDSSGTEGLTYILLNGKLNDKDMNEYSNFKEGRKEGV